MKKYYYFLPLLLIIGCMTSQDYINASENSSKVMLTQLNIKFASLICYEGTEYWAVRKFECVANTINNSLIRIICHPQIDSVTCSMAL